MLKLQPAGRGEEEDNTMQQRTWEDKTLFSSFSRGWTVSSRFTLVDEHTWCFFSRTVVKLINLQVKHLPSVIALSTPDVFSPHVLLIASRKKKKSQSLDFSTDLNIKTAHLVSSCSTLSRRFNVHIETTLQLGNQKSGCGPSPKGITGWYSHTAEDEECLHLKETHRKSHTRSPSLVLRHTQLDILKNSTTLHFPLTSFAPSRIFLDFCGSQCLSSLQLVKYSVESN